MEENAGSLEDASLQRKARLQALKEKAKGKEDKVNEVLIIIIILVLIVVKKWRRESFYCPPPSIGGWKDETKTKVQKLQSSRRCTERE